MRERELRIALVCFGGASLAIYMHGITKEVLKLARASSALHRRADVPLRSQKRVRRVISFLVWYLSRASWAAV